MKVAIALLLFAVLAHNADGQAVDDPIASAVRPYVADHQIGGAVVLVGTKDKVLDEQVAGYADVATKTPMRADDLFWIASMTKPITATAIMVLVDEGKLSVDDPVEKYLPEFHNLRVMAVAPDEKETVHISPDSKTVPASHPILIREILSHTAGLERYSDKERNVHGSDDKDPGGLDYFSLEEGSKSYAAMPLRTQPGTHFRYANAGLNIAGRIVEVVSGMPYATFLQTRIFDPLGMKDTTFWPTKEQLTRLATNYELDADGKNIHQHTLGQLHYPLDDRTRTPMPAGGLFSTAGDMLSFCQMVLNGGTFHGKRLLSEAAVRMMTSKQTGALKNQYGFAWYTTTPGGSFSHGGGDKTDMTIDPKTGLITILMEQVTGEWPVDHGVPLRKAIDAEVIATMAKPH
jgi:CubicO group peptidase (beta-lactamase class C family)